MYIGLSSIRTRTQFVIPALIPPKPKNKSKTSVFSLITSSSMSYHTELAAAKKAACLAARLCQRVQKSLLQSDVHSKLDKTPVTVADYEVSIPEVDEPTELAKKFITEIALGDRTFPTGADPPKYILPNIQSEGSKNPMDETEMLKRAQLKMREKARSSSTTPVASMPPPSKRAKTGDGATASLPGSSPSKSINFAEPIGEIALSFPSCFLSSHEVDIEVMPHAEKLLFPAAESRLQTMDIEGVMSQGTGYLLQALQNNLAATKYVKGVAAAERDQKKKVGELTNEVNRLKNTINNFEAKKQREISKVKEEMEAELKRVRQSLADRETKVTKLEDEISKLQSEVTRLTEENKNVEAFTTMFQRAKVAYEAVILRKGNDDLYNYINQWLEVGQMSDLGPSPVAENHLDETGGSQVDDLNKVEEQIADSAEEAT